MNEWITRLASDVSTCVWTDYRLVHYSQTALTHDDIDPKAHITVIKKLLYGACASSEPPLTFALTKKCEPWKLNGRVSASPGVEAVLRLANPSRRRLAVPVYPLVFEFEPTKKVSLSSDTTKPPPTLCTIAQFHAAGSRRPSAIGMNGMRWSLDNAMPEAGQG